MKPVRDGIFLMRLIEQRRSNYYFTNIFNLCRLSLEGWDEVRKKASL